MLDLAGEIASTSAFSKLREAFGDAVLEEQVVGEVEAVLIVGLGDVAHARA